MTTETKVDPRSLTTAALEAKRTHAAKSAQEILDDYRQKAAADGTNDPYAIMGDDTWQLYKGHMQDLEHIENEMTRRAELDNGEARIKAALSGAPAGISTLGGLMVASGPGAMTLGEAFAKSDVYERHYEKTGGFTAMQDPLDFSFYVNGFRGAKHSKVGEKALIYSGSAVGGALTIPFYDTTIEPAARPTPDVTDLVSRVSVGTDTVNWTRQTARSTAATAVAEATNSTGTSGTKPEATITYERVTSPVETIAVTAAVTERELADASQIAAIINMDLMDDLRLQLDAQILSGNGTTPNLTGILNSGIQTVANTTAFENVLDAMLRAQVVIMTANEPPPDAYVFNPLDWEPMRVLKSTGDGNYFGGSPFAPFTPALWGLPVVVTNQMTANTGLTGAFKRATRLYEREGIVIRIGWVNDDFARNLVRVRAEMRAGFAVRRPSAIARVTGI